MRMFASAIIYGVRTLAARFRRASEGEAITFFTRDDVDAILNLRAARVPRQAVSSQASS